MCVRDLALQDNLCPKGSLLSPFSRDHSQATNRGRVLRESRATTGSFSVILLGQGQRTPLPLAVSYLLPHIKKESKLIVIQPF